MANNYTLFSEVVPALKRREEAWIKQVLSDSTWAVKQLASAGVQFELDGDHDWPGFEWEIQKPSSKDLWIHASEGGDLQHVAHFVRAFLAKFRSGDCWKMTWAETCSSPRVGEFGGGGMFVTAKAIEFFEPHLLLAREEAAFEKGLRP